MNIINKVETKKVFLKAEAILKYFLGNEEIETLVMCKPNNVTLFTYDQSLYEAIGSLKEEEKTQLAKLAKLLENVNVLSYQETLKQQRKILRQERVDELRSAVNDQNKQNTEEK